MKKKIIIAITVIVVILLAIPYLNIYNQKVVEYRGERLIESIDGDTRSYTGSFGIARYIEITSQFVSENETNVSFKLPGDMYFEYQLKFTKKEDTKQYINIMQSDELMFEGYYYSDTSSGIYFNNDGEIVSIFAIYSEDETNDYLVPDIDSIVKVALATNVFTRGDPMYLTIAIITIILVLVDIIFPRFFFTLRYSLGVEDPEPSDFYLVTQKIGWGIAPIIVIILLIASVW